MRNGRAPSPSGIDGLRAVEVEEAVVRSQKERRFVPVPRIAVGSLAYSQLPLEEALERIARLGVPSVELAVHEGWAHLSPSQIAQDVPAAVARVKEALGRTGVVPVALNVGLGVMSATADAMADAAARGAAGDALAGGSNGAAVAEEEKRRLAAVAEFARALGVRTITLPAAPAGTPVDTEVERLTRLVSLARPFGVQLNIETHVGQVTEDPAVAAEIARRVPGLGLTLDPSHYYAGSLQSGAFEPVLPYVRHVHLRDAGRSLQEIQMPVGKGRVDFARLFGLLRESGYLGDFGVEYIDSIDLATGSTEASGPVEAVGQAEKAGSDAVGRFSRVEREVLAMHALAEKEAQARL